MPVDLDTFVASVGQSRGSDIPVMQQPDAIEFKEPINPPGKWTKFLVAISGLGLSSERIRKAQRQEIRYGDLLLANRQFLNALYQSASAAGYLEVATKAGLALRKRQCITGNEANEILRTATEPALIRKENRDRIDRYLNHGDEVNGTLASFSLEDRFNQKLGKSAWSGLSDSAREFVTRYIQLACAEHDRQRRGEPLRGDDVGQMTDAAIDRLEKLHELCTTEHGLSWTQQAVNDALSRAVSQAGTTEDLFAGASSGIDLLSKR